MDNPLVSIITPSFNRADVVTETAESILSQTYPNWEWMVVDDGSTDGSQELLHSLSQQDSRIRILSRQRDPKGACTCRNIGVMESTGSHLLFLDTDDILAPECLENRVSAASSMPEMDFVIFPMRMFHKRPNDTDLLWNTETGEDDLARILYGDPICQGTGTLWKKGSFLRAGLWDESLAVWQDVELHARSLLMGMTFGKRMDLPPDVHIRMSQTSLSRTGFNSKAKLDSRVRVLSQIVETMKEMGWLARYREPLRHMFIGVFFGAANSRQTSFAERLMALDLGWGLFRSGERGWLWSYALMQQYRLNRVGPLQAYVSEKINSFVPKRKSNIGVIAYRQSGS